MLLTQAGGVPFTGPEGVNCTHAIWSMSSGFGVPHPVVRSYPGPALCVIPPGLWLVAAPLVMSLSANGYAAGLRPMFQIAGLAQPTGPLIPDSAHLSFTSAMNPAHRGTDALVPSKPLAGGDDDRMYRSLATMETSGSLRFVDEASLPGANVVPVCQPGIAIMNSTP